MFRQNNCIVGRRITTRHSAAANTASVQPICWAFCSASQDFPFSPHQLVDLDKRRPQRGAQPKCDTKPAVAIPPHGAR